MIMPEISGLIQNYLEGSIKTIGKVPVIESKTITENGIYTAPSGVDGYSPITVNVPIPEPSLTEQVVINNGTYLPPEGYDGFSKVVVDVPTPTMDDITITQNGTYLPASYNLDGFDQVVVNVPDPEPKTYFNLQNRLYIEGSMSYTNVTLNKFDSVWNGGGSVGFSLNGIVNLRGKTKVIVDVDNIGTSYGSGELSRFNFNFGLLNQIFTTYVLLESNTAGKLISYGIAPYADYHDQSYHGELTIPDQDCYLYVACNGVNAQGISVEII